MDPVWFSTRAVTPQLSSGNTAAAEVRLGFSGGRIWVQQEPSSCSQAKNEKQNVELQHPLALTPPAGSLVLTDVLL